MLRTATISSDGDIARVSALILLSDKRIGLNVLARSAFRDHALAFWGHHRLIIEQLAGIAGQSQLRLELRNALVGGSQLVGLNSRVPSMSPASMRA